MGNGMARLEGKVAVITGGAGGIGRAAGAMFAREGAAVLLVDLEGGQLDEAVRACGSNRVSAFVADVTRAADNEAMIRAAEERYGGVDILLANAGVEGRVAPIVDYPEEEFDRVLAVNVRGPFLGLKAAIPALKRRGGGSIVITSSVAGVTGTPGISAYGTSKHAVIGLMRAAALECAADNIRVNTVNPSPVETRMMRSLEAGMGDAAEVKRGLEARIPMQRYADPDDIARVMLFLASEDSNWVTGSVQMADGGFTV
jgi:NAD(P)-dependent dehydrogenase (short-subunit alcohol dehydrogenase family)